jgi:hypothetical protein
MVATAIGWLCGSFSFATAESGAKHIYVANFASSSLSIFPVGSNGNVPSMFTQTFLNSPRGITYHAGNLYVTNQGDDAIRIYPANAAGRPNPIATIRGSKTRLNNPNAIAVDSAGTIYVINEGAQGDVGVITSYMAGSHGNVAPKTVIKGPHARLDGPTAIASDAEANIYVTIRDSILVFSAGSNGNASPARIIAGAASRVRFPQGIAVSAKGYIYVTTQQNIGTLNGVEILIFAPGANGNVVPVSGIDGDCDPTVSTAGPLAVGAEGRIYVATTELNPRTGLNRPKIVVFKNQLIENPEFAPTTPPPGPLCGNVAASVSGWDGDIVDPYSFAVDPTGNMYVTDSQQNTISIVPAGSNGEIKSVAKFGGDTGILAPTGVALDANGKIYAANDGVATGHSTSDDVTVYPAGSNANVSPIAGTSNLSSPQAVAVGSDGTIYVANGTGGYQDHGTISISPPSLEGKAKVRTIGGTSANDVTRLNDPSALALDSNGNLYAVNSGSPGSVTVYGPSADGNVPPIRAIPANDTTKLDSPVGVALDGTGKIYVTNDGSIGGKPDSIFIYAPSSDGSVAPIATIAGPNTQLKLPQGIAIDSDGTIYVANVGNLEELPPDATRYDDRPRADPADSITVYAPGSSGDVAPIARINGSLTGLGHPRGIAVGP